MIISVWDRWVLFVVVGFVEEAREKSSLRARLESQALGK